jgi:UDP-N-acetylglucosamine 2-epimerase (non-hydrolysing)
MKLLLVVGARPNFMKAAPLLWEMKARPRDFEPRLVHTGQHYDAELSRVFFEDLELPEPDCDLGVGSGSHARQTAEVMIRFEPVLLEARPDRVVVVGDVNSTLAAALVAAKLGVPLAHVEAGLRSFDRSMPEELNRVLTDQLSDALFTTSEEAAENLAREGIPPGRVHFAGNVMIDALVKLLPRAEALYDGLRARFGLDRFALVTLHRPANVDRPEVLGEILAALAELAREIPVLFPVHPRTAARLSEAGLEAGDPRLRLIEPLRYVEFLALEKRASLVVTDSGGVQEETTYLGVPCLTVRPNTERPVTITAGTNRLVPAERKALLEAAGEALRAGTGRRPQAPPPLWDGRAAARIVERLLELG